MQTGDEVAIKLMEYRKDPRELEDELRTYKALAGEVGIPRVYWFGEEGDYMVLVFEILGPSLEDVFNYCDRRFSLKTILLIADQALSRMERIHRRFLHRDVKPDNLLLGTGRQGNILYTIDFGLAKEFSDDERHRGFQGLPFGGTTRYASINNHKGLGKHSEESPAVSLWLTWSKSNHGGMIWNPSDTCSSTLLAVLYRGRV